MARNIFGGRLEDFVYTISGSTMQLIQPLPTINLYTASTGGSLVTDLQTYPGGVAISSITPRSNGQIPAFYGPNDGSYQLWADAGTGTRVLLEAQQNPVSSGQSVRVDLAQPLTAGQILQAQQNIQVDPTTLNNTYGTFFNVMKYGAKGDGVTDDTAALQNAIAAAMPVSGTVFAPPGTYMFSAELQLLGSDRAVTLVGSGMDHNGTVFKAKTSAARISWGQTPTGVGLAGVTGYGRPGTSGNWSFDGNQIATQGVMICPTAAYGTWQNIQVWKVNGHGFLVYGQNDTFIACNSGGHSGHGWVFDYGVQQCQFFNCNASANDGWNYYFRQSGGSGWGASAQPQALSFFGGIGEQPGSPYFANTGLGGIFIREGVDISFTRFDLSSNAGQYDLEIVPAVTSGCYSGRITLRDCRSQQTIYLNANTITQVATLSSPLSTSGAITALPVTATTASIPAGQQVQVVSGTHNQIFTYSGAGTLAAGVTSIPVNSLTPTYAFPTGSTISNIVAGSMGGTNEPLLLEGWNTLLGGIICGTSGYVYDGGKGSIASFTPWGNYASYLVVPQSITKTSGTDLYWFRDSSGTLRARFDQYGGVTTGYGQTYQAYLGTISGYSGLNLAGTLLYMSGSNTLTTNGNLSSSAGVAATGVSTGDAQGVAAGTYIGKSSGGNGGIDFADGTSTYGIDTYGAANALRFTKASTAVLGQIDSTGNLGMAQGIKPGPITASSSPQILSGTGAPTSSAPGGSYYFRTDTPGTANQRIYVNTSAGTGTTWAALI